MYMNQKRKTTNGVLHTMATLTCCFLFNLLFFYMASAMSRDIDNLISFKNSLPNPNLLFNWNSMYEVCEFQGVTCKENHVSSLTIRGLPLEVDFNSVSAHILSLENLEALSFHSTDLNGSISALSNCTMQLKELDLSNNNLQGSVYDTISLAASCHSLQSLNLSNNYIGQVFNRSSPVLPQLRMLDLSNNKITTNKNIQWLFSKLRLLKYLDLSNNTIKGPVPEITNCTSLQYLDLSSNQLTGTILPGTFSSCLNLSYLNLSSNHFTGMAPPDIKACTNLVTLSLSNNNFSGEFPMWSLAPISRLQFLELGFNNFNGNLSKSISNLTSLELLDLSANKFSGPIPRPLCTYSVSYLKVLYLQDNYFTGSIPDSLCNCTNLVSLDLSMNLLSGSIPNSLGSLSNLMDLIMWQNNLNGEIPGQLSSLMSLQNLLLDYNNLTGAIPDGLVNCTNLNWISLKSNRLTGSLPIWIGKLEKLVMLLLGNNSFIGSIPPELGDCRNLLYLSLHSNQLNGSIPPSLAKQAGKIVADQIVVGRPYVDLLNPKNSQCPNTGVLEFDGIRMDDLIRLPSIQYCNFTRVYKSATTKTGEYFSNDTSMVYIDLSYNRLEGHIPIEITTMQSLGLLNLKHNSLSGPLPQELGGLIHLSLLDLSYNTFEGRIPSSFSALSLTILDLSNNLLSGPIPEGGSFITFPKDVFENNSGLCGIPLPPCNDLSMPKEDMPKQSSTNHESSLGWWITVGLLFFIFLIIGLIIGQFLR